MNIYWQGADITGLVQVRKCVIRDTCGGRCDSLEMEFDNAAGWIKWGPEEDDQIVVTRDGYDTGILYLNAVLPEDGHYRVIATALPCAARQRESRSYAGKTLGEIMQTCGIVTGMDVALYGISWTTAIPYVQQENESAASFLNRLLEWEGAKLKCVNGKYVGIGLAYAQARNAPQTLALAADQQGVEYRRCGETWRSVRVLNPYADTTAIDTDAPESHARICLSLPARNAAQAGRWARGALLAHNREAERLVIETEFNPLYTAMTRIDIEGETDAAGSWLIEETEHDLRNGSSRAVLYRCKNSIR